MYCAQIVTTFGKPLEVHGMIGCSFLNNECLKLETAGGFSLVHWGRTLAVHCLREPEPMAPKIFNPVFDSAAQESQPEVADKNATA
jgi:hypothetical protein